MFTYYLLSVLVFCLLTLIQTKYLSDIADLYNQCTLTHVAVDLIYTGTAVLTGCTGTFVYVCQISIRLFKSGG